MNMATFALVPRVVIADPWAPYIAELKLTAEDVVFTVRPLRARWIDALGVAARVVCYEDFGHGEPTDEVIDRIWDAVRSGPCRRIVAIGGGSVLDVAKIVALKRTGTALQVFRKEVEIAKEIPLILIPTTCGTGSEVTNIAIAAIPSLGTKLGLAVDPLFADQAVLCPELAVGLPEQVLVTSAIDALVHAMESYLSPRSHAYPELFSVRAMEILLTSFRQFVSQGRMATVPDLIRDVMIASNYAGIAFGNTGVGAVHALSYPLSGTYHVPHGEANSRFLLAVFRAYQALDPNGKIRDIEALITRIWGTEASGRPWDDLEVLIDRLLPKKPLRDYGMPSSQIADFAATVQSTQQRLLANNYRPLTTQHIADIYTAIY